MQWQITLKLDKQTESTSISSTTLTKTSTTTVTIKSTAATYAGELLDEYQQCGGFKLL